MEDISSLERSIRSFRKYMQLAIDLNLTFMSCTKVLAKQVYLIYLPFNCILYYHGSDIYVGLFRR